MATEEKILDITLPANGDLSTAQYRAVAIDGSTGKVRMYGATTDLPIGVLQNAPNAVDLPAVVRPIGCGGVTKMQLNGTLSTYGAIVAGAYTGASDAGRAQAAVTTQYPVGVLLTTGAVDELATVLLCPLTVKA